MADNTATLAKQAKLDFTSTAQKVSESELKNFFHSGGDAATAESPTYKKKIPVCGKKGEDTCHV